MIIFLAVIVIILFAWIIFVTVYLIENDKKIKGLDNRHEGMRINANSNYAGIEVLKRNHEDMFALYQSLKKDAAKLNTLLNFMELKIEEPQCEHESGVTFRSMSLSQTATYIDLLSQIHNGFHPEPEQKKHFNSRLNK